MDSADSGFKTLTIAIVGLGLIGGSYAKGFRRLGIAKIIGVDVDEATRKEALSSRSVDVALAAGTQELQAAQLVIFCLPADKMIQFISENVEYFHPQAILTDVAGIKGNTASEIQALLPEMIDFVPGHPMAGREGCGFSQSDAAIFKDANYIIVPQAGNKPEHIQLIAELVKALGCSHVISVSPAEHDRMIAYTSSLPHVLATTLVNSASMNDQVKYFIAGSFRDGTRVADINAPLWTQLFFSNKDNLLEEIDHFRDSLDEFRKLLMTEDKNHMTEFLQKAADRRRGLIHGKHTC